MAKHAILNLNGTEYRLPTNSDDAECAAVVERVRGQLAQWTTSPTQVAAATIAIQPPGTQVGYTIALTIRPAAVASYAVYAVNE